MSIPTRLGYYLGEERLYTEPEVSALRADRDRWREQAALKDAEVSTLLAERDRLLVMIREYAEAVREVDYRRNAWTGRLEAAELALLAEVKP